MPECKEGYRSKIVDQIMGTRSVVEVAQELVECVSGAADGQPPGFRANCIRVLQFYLDHWTWHSTGHPAYDAAVYHLIREAYDYGRHTAKS